MDLAAAGMNSLRPGTVLDGERVTYGGGLQVEVRQGCPSKRNKLSDLSPGAELTAPGEITRFAIRRAADASQR
ncbi:hypothetical protein ACWFRM_22395 [Streptomyces sp. NPDC055144]